VYELLATPVAPDVPVAANTSAPDEAVGTGVTETLALEDAVGQGVGVGVVAGVDEGVDVGVDEGVGEGVGVGVAEGLGVAVAPGDAHGDAVGDADADADGEGLPDPPRGGGNDCAPAVTELTTKTTTPAATQAAPSTARTRDQPRRMEHSYPTAGRQTQSETGYERPVIATSPLFVRMDTLSALDKSCVMPLLLTSPLFVRIAVA